MLQKALGSGPAEAGHLDRFLDHGLFTGRLGRFLDHWLFTLAITL